MVTSMGRGTYGRLGIGKEDLDVKVGGFGWVGRIWVDLGKVGWVRWVWGRLGWFGKAEE